MSFLSRLFGSRSGEEAATPDLEERLQQLEREAASARPGYVGTAFNRAGDLARKEGQLERAVGYYGRAVDAFLDDAQREAARGVANKIIRVRPQAVRTLCTLTWLDLAAGHSATALLHLRDYVAAATSVGRQGLAADQLHEMARITPDTEFIAAVADALDGLDRPDEAARVREWVTTNGSPEAIRDAGELSRACLRAAVVSAEGGAGERSAPGAAPTHEEPTRSPAGSGDEGSGEKRRSRRRYRWD